jgi:hypothetical protein
MCSRSAIKAFASVMALGAVLGGCSEYYFDRRDTVAIHSGDAVATNRVTQMIDPWPLASGNRNIAYNGEKAAAASARYRTGKIIPPVSPLTNSSYQQQQQQQLANDEKQLAPNAGANAGSSPTK